MKKIISCTIVCVLTLTSFFVPIANESHLKNGTFFEVLAEELDVNTFEYFDNDNYVGDELYKNITDYNRETLLGIKDPNEYFLGAASQFSVFLNGDFNANESDCEGRLAAAGNANLGNETPHYSVGAKLENAEDIAHVVIGGDTLVNFGANQKNFVMGENHTIGEEVATYLANGNCNVYVGELFSFEEQFALLNQRSEYLVEQEDNAVLEINPYINWGWTIRGEDKNFNVVTLTDEQFETFDGGYIDLTFDIPDGSYIVINVPGNQVDMPRTSVYTVDSSGQKTPTYENTPLLYNLYEATSFHYTGSIQGSTLAPNADATGDQGGHVAGATIAKSFEGGIEFGYSKFDTIYLEVADPVTTTSASNHIENLSTTTMPANISTPQTTLSTKPEDVEKDPKIENVQMYLEIYKEALDNYIKATKNASRNDYNEVKKNSSDKEGYLKLMEYDSSKTSSNRLITFGFLGNSKEEKNAREDTYEVLYEFLIKSIDAANQKNIINFDIDNSKTLPEIEANMINKIYDSVKKTCKNPDQGTGSHGYTVDLDVYGGIFGFGFGKVTITKGDKKYDAIYCSDSNLVAKAMNQYIDDLCNEVKKQYKDASFVLWKYFLDTSTINSIRTDIMKQKLEDYTDTLIEMGYGKLLENIVIAKDTYETFSEVLKYSRKIDYNTLKSLLSENDKEKSKLFFKAIKNGKLSDKEVKNKLVSDAMNKLEKARQNAESALYDYIYDANTLKGESKSWIKSIFSCPVNVDVIDDVTQEVVGYVHDGEVYSDGSIEVEYSYEMKSVTLPKDKKYRFVLTGTDDGNMQIIYKDIIDGYEESYIAFYDVPLREGIVYTQDITTANLQDDISLFPELIADDSTTISASAYYKSQDEDRYISITSNTSSGGVCYGGGEYTKGDSVLLSAVPSEGYQFDGWYEDDILVCCNDVFRFPAMYNRNINAKFEKVYNEADDCSWNINEAYIGDLTFWNYRNKENLNIEFSIYTEHSKLEAVLCYSNDVENKIQLTTEDGIHYLIENIIVDGLKLIVITDSDGNEIASLKLIESGNTSDVATTTIGDINNDGSVDSSDASLVLAEYAKIQTGGVGEFTETQHKAADVNNDGVVDSSDASKILAYYAMISTGKEPIWD